MALHGRDGSSRGGAARALTLTLSLALLTAATVAGAAGAGGRGLTMAGGSGPAGGAAPEPAPKNGRIAFVRNADNGMTDVASFDERGAGRINITRSPENELYVDVSPDGRRVAFTRFTDQGGEIYTASMTGGDVQRVTNDAVHDELPIWSPDGTRLAFIRYPQGGDGEVFVIDADGQNRTRVTRNDTDDADPRWSPDGTKLIHTAGNMDENEQDVFLVTLGEPDGTPIMKGDVNDTFAEWSPDGESVVYSSFRDEQWDIFTYSLDDETSTQLTTHPSDDYAAEWSPDGKRLVFVRGRLEGMKPRDEVYVMRADGTGQHSVSMPRLHAFSPDWSPDGRKIAFIGQVPKKDALPEWEVFKVRRDGTHSTRLTYTASQEFDPEWAPKPERPALAYFTDEGAQVATLDGEILSRYRDFQFMSLGGNVLAGSRHRPGNRSEDIFGYDASTGATELFVIENAWGPVVTARGRRVFFAPDRMAHRDPYGTSLWVRMADGRERRVVQLTGPNATISRDPFNGDGIALAWAVDGKGRKLAVAFGNDVDIFKYDVWVVDVKTREATRMTRGMKSRFPSLSPSGKRLAVTLEVDECGGPGAGYRASDLRVMSSSGQRKRTLLPGTCKLYYTDPRWASDTELVAARLTKTGPGQYDADLVRIDVASAKVTPIDVGGPISYLTVSPSLHQIAFHLRTDPGGFGLYDLRTGAIRRFDEGYVPRLSGESTLI